MNDIKIQLYIYSIIKRINSFNILTKLILSINNKILNIIEKLK